MINRQNSIFYTHEMMTQRLSDEKVSNFLELYRAPLPSLFHAAQGNIPWASFLGAAVIIPWKRTILEVCIYFEGCTLA